jgi:hypothetical protein
MYEFRRIYSDFGKVPPNPKTLGELRKNGKKFASKIVGEYLLIRRLFIPEKLK